MDASQMAVDAMYYVKEISAVLLIVGGVSFADIAINFLVNLVNKVKTKETNVKW